MYNLVLVDQKVHLLKAALLGKVQELYLCMFILIQIKTFKLRHMLKP